MDYRGSKSDLVNKFVKEQRVDGSWSNGAYLDRNTLYDSFLNKPHLIDLRCILMGFERNGGIKLGFNMQQGWNSYVKIPSKQFDLKKFSISFTPTINPLYDKFDLNA